MQCISGRSIIKVLGKNNYVLLRKKKKMNRDFSSQKRTRGQVERDRDIQPPPRTVVEPPCYLEGSPSFRFLINFENWDTIAFESEAFHNVFGHLQVKVERAVF